jgi:hypothetical protein
MPKGRRCYAANGSLGSEEWPFCHHASDFGAGKENWPCGVVVLNVDAGALLRLPGRVLDSHETVGRPILTEILQKQGVSKGTFDCASRKRVRVLWVADQKLEDSHCPDPRKPQPLPARLSVDVTAN